jgi:hypothetical protein
MTTTVFLVLLAGHLLGDWVTQSDWQAANKTRSWAALAAHVSRYHLVMGALLLIPVLRDSWPASKALLIMTMSAATHALIDRRWPVVRCCGWPAAQGSQPSTGASSPSTRPCTCPSWRCSPSCSADDHSTPRFLSAGRALGGEQQPWAADRVQQCRSGRPGAIAVRVSAADAAQDAGDRPYTRVPRKVSSGRRPLVGCSHRRQAHQTWRPSRRGAGRAHRGWTGPPAATRIPSGSSPNPVSRSRRPSQGRLRLMSGPRPVPGAGRQRGQRDRPGSRGLGGHPAGRAPPPSWQHLPAPSALRERRELAELAHQLGWRG